MHSKACVKLLVTTPVESPNLESLATAMASSRSATEMMGASGPNDSSQANYCVGRSPTIATGRTKSEATRTKGVLSTGRRADL